MAVIDSVKDEDRVICYGEPPTGLMHGIRTCDAIRSKIIEDKLEGYNCNIGKCWNIGKGRKG